MNDYQKISYWLYDSYEFAILDNNRIDWFVWHNEAASLAETNEQIWSALRILLQLWTPISLAVTMDSFTFDVPDEVAREEIVEPVALDEPGKAIDVLVERIRELCAKKEEIQPGVPWGISLVGPTLHGWIRLAIPQGARERGDWVIAGEDRIVTREYELQDAPAMHQIESKWLRVKDMSLCSDLSFFVRAVGEVEVRMTLGLTVFKPDNDVRPPDTLVRGVPLAQWQDVNGALLKHVFEELQQAGWEPARN